MVQPSTVQVSDLSMVTIDPLEFISKSGREEYAR